MRAGELFQRGNIDFHVEVAGIANHRAILHFFEVFVRDDGLVAGDGDEDFADFGGFGHGHHAETVHDGFQGARGIDFGDDHVRAVTFGAHGDAASAPAVAGDDDAHAREQHVGGANDAVERGLACAVAIVEEMLGERVVDGDDGILQRAVLGHGAQANDAGGGFFGAADDVGHELGALGEQLVTRSAPSSMVICGLWSMRRGDVRVVGGVVLALDGVGGDAVVLDQGGGDFVLRGKRIRAAEDHVGAAVTQSDGEVRGFAGDVQASGHADALQRLLLDELLADELQHGHLLIGPFDFAFAFFGES